MPRPRLEHIVWAKTVPHHHRASLAESAVDAPDLAALGLPAMAGLPRDPRATFVALEAALATMVGAPGGRVLVTAGASEANAAVFAALLEPGDEVLVETPGYEPLRVVPGLFGACVRAFPRTADHPVAEAVAAALTSATRLVVITDPHNPTGARLDAADARALDALASRHHLHVLCDETFRDAATDPPGTWSALGDRWVCTSTLTKSYGLGGLRIGWAAAAPELRERIARAHDAFSAEPAQPSAALALALLPHLPTLRARTHAILARNRAQWEAFGARHPRFATAVPPVITAFATPGGRGDGDAFAALAAERFDLALTPGRFFGAPQGVRIGLGAEPVRFDAAFALLERATEAFPVFAHSMESA